MPNRKRNTGWYLLPKSGTPFYGEVPEGAKTLSQAEAKKHAVGTIDERPGAAAIGDGKA